MKGKILFIMLILLAIPVLADPIDIYCATFSSKDVCLKQIAEDRQDPTYCEDIETVQTKNSCYSNLAKQLNDQLLCEEVKKDGDWDQRDRCFMKFVNNLDDMYICDEWIKDDRNRDDCYDEMLDIKLNLSICPMFSTDSRIISCYRKIARKRDDASICDMMNILQPEERGTQCGSFKSSALCTGGDEGLNIDDEIKECKESIRLEKAVDECTNNKHIQNTIRFRRENLFSFGDEGKQFKVYFREFDKKNTIVAIDLEDVTFVDMQVGDVRTKDNKKIIFMGIEEQGHEGEVFYYAEVCIYEVPESEVEEPEPEPEVEEEEPEPEIEEEETEEIPEPIVEENITEEPAVIVQEPEEKKGFIMTIFNSILGIFGYEWI